jgi:hypothetical protein
VRQLHHDLPATVHWCSVEREGNDDEGGPQPRDLAHGEFRVFFPTEVRRGADVTVESSAGLHDQQNVHCTGCGQLNEVGSRKRRAHADVD